MSSWHPSSCRGCNAKATPERTISAKGYCLECGTRREVDNIAQLKERAGPFYEHWLRRSFMAHRRELLALDNSKGL